MSDDLVNEVEELELTSRNPTTLILCVLSVLEKKMTRKEQKKRQKQLEYEMELKAMGSKAFEKEPENADEQTKCRC